MTADVFLPGGTTPGPDDIVRWLDWSRVDIVLNDERWVPKAQDNMRCYGPDCCKITRKPPICAFMRPMTRPSWGYPRIAHVEACLPIHVLLLGMGEDMHTASHFPVQIGLRGPLRACANSVGIARAGSARASITLSAAVLKAAHQVMC